jgi:type VI secretion system protein ImpG
LNPHFIELYNEELRFLREAGKSFADAYPQVAGQLGMHEDAVSDPFVERLLEGVAFLSARVHARLDVEHAEFARQVLSRVAPLWNEATPSIATIAFEPDFSSPESINGQRIKKGSIIQANLPGNSSVRFATGQEVHLLPLELSQVRCAQTISHLPPRIAARAVEAAGVIAFEFTAQSSAKLGELETDHLDLTLAGDVPLALTIQKTMLHGSFKVFAWGEDSIALDFIELAPSDLAITGISDEEALLPPSANMLPGLRLLREYFAQPARFLGVRVGGLSKLFKKIPGHKKFHLVFMLKSEPTQIMHRIGVGNFRLFATPVINLYPKKFDPLIYNPDQTDQWTVVDRMRPLAFDIHHVTDCRAMLVNGRSVDLSPVPARDTFSAGNHEGFFSYRKQHVTYGAIDHSALRDQLPARHFISASLSSDIGTPEDIKFLQIDGYVSDHGWYREKLDRAGFTMQSACSVQKIECLRLPSEARDEPLPERHWEAVQLLGSNPLRIRSRGEHDVDSALRLWLSLASAPSIQGDQRRIASIDRAKNSLGFSRSPVPGPMSWVRSNRLFLNVDSKSHPDGGAWLFSRIVCQALLDCVNLNDALEVDIQFDGEPADRFSNLAPAKGRH